MFAIELSKEKRIKIFLSAWFSDLPAINATSFSNQKNERNHILITNTLDQIPDLGFLPLSSMPVWLKFTT